MRLHVALELARLRARVVAQLALVGLLARVAAPVHDEIALELEGLAAELARLALGRRLRRRRATGGHGRQRRRAQERGLGAGLERVQEPVHRVAAARGHGRRRGAVARQLAEPPREVHGGRVDGHGVQAHDSVEGTGVLGDEPHLLGAEAVRVQVVAWRRAEERRRARQAALTEAWVVPQDGARHAQQVEGVAVAQEIHERGLGHGLGSQRRRDGKPRRERAAGRPGLQVDAEAVRVLRVLQQEPRAVEGLLACCANVAGRLIFTWGDTRTERGKRDVRCGRRRGSRGAAAGHCRAGPGQRPPGRPPGGQAREASVWLLLQLVDLTLCPYNMVSLNPSSQKPKEMLFVRKPDSNNGKYTKAGLPKR